MLWQGGYAGVHIGRLAAQTQVHDIAFDIHSKLNSSSTIGGLLAGFNFVQGNWVSGFEADIGFASASSADPIFQIDSKFRWAANGRLRMGYAIDRTLFFVAGGISFANIQQAAFGFQRQDYFAYGLTIGAGVETYIAPNWLFRAEYLYTGYHRFDQTYSDVREQVTTTVETQIGRAALIYKFGSGETAPRPAASSGPANWSGVYFGLHAGHKRMHTSHTDIFVGILNYQDRVSIYDAWGGGLAGFNIQYFKLVLGLELDFGLGNLDGFDNQGLVVSKLRWDAHIRARIGYAFDKYLVFMTTGVALAQLQQHTLFDVAPGSGMFTGYTIGAGFDIMLTPNFIFRAEYLLSRFETQTIIHVDSGAIFDTELTTNTVRAAIIYKYENSGFGAPAGLPRSNVQWSGPYVGAFAGYQTFKPHLESGAVIDDFTARDFAGGLLFGANYQAGNWVFGAEADVGWSSAKVRQFSACLCYEIETKAVIETHWRARLGYAFDRYLAFVTAGLAVGHFEQNAIGLALKRRAHAGFTLGGGLDAAITDNLFARIEYLYTEYGLQNYNYYPADPLGPMADSSYRTQIWRGAVIYRFNP